jgi:transcriptional regulator with XRE-family HTH domain
MPAPRRHTEPENLAIAKLDRILDQRHMTDADLARQLKIKPPTIVNWRQGGMPRPNLIKRITDWSYGAIVPADWFEAPTIQAHSDPGTSKRVFVMHGGGVLTTNFDALVEQLTSK